MDWLLLSALENLDKKGDELRALNSQVKIWVKIQKAFMSALKESLISWSCRLRFLKAKPKVYLCGWLKDSAN